MAVAKACSALPSARNSKYLLTGSNLLNTVRLLEIDSHQLWDVTNRDELISLGVKRVTGMQLDPTECSVLREMEIPIFNIMGYQRYGVSVPIPLPWAGLNLPVNLP